MFARYPVSRVDYEITYRPAHGVEQKVFDVDRRIVTRLKTIAGHVFCTSQVRVSWGCPVPARGVGAWRYGPSGIHRIRGATPERGTGPIVRIAIVVEEIRLVLSRNRLVGVDIRTLLDLPSGQFDLHYVPLPVDLFQGSAATKVPLSIVEMGMVENVEIVSGNVPVYLGLRWNNPYPVSRLLPARWNT
jgi:hypothetical protein